MKYLNKINSAYSLSLLFSFVSEKRKLKIVKYNSFLLKQLGLSIINYKRIFFLKKLENYDFFHFQNYYKKFKEDFKQLFKNEEEIEDILLYCLAKNKNLNLKLSDTNFKLLIQHPYFKGNICIWLENNISKITEGKKLIEEREKELIYFNFTEILKEKVFKISLFDVIDEEIFKILNEKLIFQNLKKLDILISNLNIMITLSITCPNVDELNLRILQNNFNYNINEINSLFPNIKILNVYIEDNFNLFDLLNNLTNNKVETLKIFIDDDIKIDLHIQSKIILNNIKYLEINIGNIVNKNGFLFNFFDIIQFPCLKEYIFHFNCDKTINQSNLQLKESDFNIINNFLLDTLSDQKQFSFKSFFTFPNKLKSIDYLELNLNLFSYIYKKKRKEKYLFKFTLFNSIVNYYKNLDLSIDENEIIQYKKIDIKGIRNDEKTIKEIKENNNINLCDLNLNLNQYLIKSFKNLRSLYFESENNNLIQNIFHQVRDFENLKYINLTLGNIEESPNIHNLSILHQILSELIQNSKKLKSLILRLHSKNFNEHIHFFFHLIQNLKKLKVLNISQNIKNPKYDLNLEKILDKFPKIKERKYCFDEFKIGNEGFTRKKKNIFNNDIKCVFEIQEELLGKKIKLLKEKIKNMSVLYLNNEKINDNEYIFQKTGKYILKIIFLNELTNMNNMFHYCSSLTSINLANFNTNNVTDMSKMFSNCTSLNSLNLSNLFTNNVKFMRKTFGKCSSLTYLNLSNFNTINVIDMSHMFSYCSSLTSLNLSSFNTNNVNDMSYLFSNCSSLTSLNLSNFNTNNVNDMKSMFSSCSSLTTLNLSNFNTNNVKNMSYMFSFCSSLISLNLSNFNTDEVKNMSFMFSGCSSLTSVNLTNFNTNKVKDMSNMFFDCSSLKTLNLSNFNTNKVKNMSYMFSDCPSLTTLDLSNFNTNNVTDMREMFNDLNSSCKIISKDQRMLNLSFPRKKKKRYNCQCLIF